MEENIQLSQDDLVKLEQMRKEDSRVQVMITDKTTILLFSLQEINSPDFVKPTENKIYLVESTDYDDLKKTKKNTADPIVLKS